MTERVWQAAVLILSAAVISLTLWCLTNGITIIFMHLYYFPIVLIAYHYRWKGFGFATLLALVYLGLVLLFDTGQPDIILGACYRFLVFVGIAAVIAYISERLVRALADQQQSTEIRERYLSLAPAIILVLDRNGAITLLNEKGCSILACSFENVEGKSWIDTFIGEEEREQVRSVFSNLMTGNLAPYSMIEGEVVTGTGTRRLIRWYNTVIRDTGSMITGTMSYGQDITDERQAQDAMRKLQQFQESVITNANVWISVLSPKGTIIVWNDAAETISGYKKTGVVGKNTIWKQLYPDKEYRHKITTEIQSIISSETYLENFETLIRCANGTKKTIVWNTRGLRDTRGNVTSYIAIGREITAQKAAEEQARWSSELYNEFFKTSRDCIFITSYQGKWIDFSESALKMFGYGTREELFRIPIAQLYHNPEERLAFLNSIGREGFTKEYPVQLQRREGSIIDTLITTVPIRNPDGSVRAFVGTIRDITEHKRAEESLAASEVKFRQFFNNITDSLYLHVVGEQGLPGKFIEVNDAMCERLGYNRDELLLLTPQDIVSEVGGVKMPSIAETMARKGHATFETEHRKKDGSIVPVEVSTIIFSLAGTRVAMASARDITERKRVEEDLIQSEERYRTLAEASPDQIFINDRNGTILYANTTGLKLFGLPYDRVVGKHRRDFFPPEMIREQSTAFEKVFDTGEPLRREARIRFGERDQWIDTNLVPLKDKAGHVTAVLGVARDITDRKRMEEALRESRQLFSDIISFLPDPTFVIDNEGTVLAWNRAFEQLSGIPAADIIGKGNHEYSIWQYGKRRPILIDLVLHPDQDYARVNYTDIHTDGHMVTAQTKFIRPDGRRIAFSLVTSPLFDTEGRTTGAIESIRDITHLKETEAELARMNQNLENLVRERTRALEEEVAQRVRAEQDVKAALDYTRSVIEANPDVMLVLDGKGTVLDVNAAAELLTGLQREQLIGTPFLNLNYLADDGNLPEIFSRLLETGRLSHTVGVRRSDGHITPLSVSGTLIHGKDTTDTRVIVSGHDITRQQQDEAAIRASLDEKVLLLREIHHRVKNNLQIIISLTNLQMRKIEEPRMKQVMAETQNRVRAMSLVHEKLYQSENIASIDLSDYTRYLASQLFSFYGIDHRKIALETDIGKIPLDINTAIPLGLIMNELISNSLRHAFPEGRTGTLSIRGHTDGDMFTFVVRDDGTGLRPDFDWRNAESLGLRLINSLVDQLGGTLELGKGPGTEFIISIPRKPEGETA